MSTESRGDARVAAPTDAPAAPATAGSSTNAPGGGGAPPAATSGPAARAAAGREAARRFVGRVAQLDLDDVRAAVFTWRQSMREEGDAWFAAEEAVARALHVSGLAQHQKALLMHVADAFARVVWSGARAHAVRDADAPELLVQATEASGQYLATVAMLAVLARAHIDASTFDRLYRPFARSIPAEALSRE